MNNKTENGKNIETIRAEKAERLSPKSIIKNALTREFPDMNETQKEIATTNIFAVSSSTKVRFGGEEYKGSTFVEMIATRIDQNDAGISRQNEYHTVIDDAKTIVDSMANGFTEAELSSRNDFVEYTIQREVELLTCLALYASANTPEAKKKYAEMQRRLLKIREARSAVINGTKTTADKTEEQIRKEKEARENDKNKVHQPDGLQRATMVMTGLALANYAKLSYEDKKKYGLYAGTMEEIEAKTTPERTIDMIKRHLDKGNSAEEVIGSSVRSAENHNSVHDDVHHQVMSREERLAMLSGRSELFKSREDHESRRPLISRDYHSSRRGMTADSLRKAIAAQRAAAFR